MKNIIYIVVFVLILSCESRTKFEKPENLIPKAQMVDLLTDMHLASGTLGIKNKNSKKKENYMALVYEKYKIDSTQFAASNTYYTSNVDEYEEIFEEVEKRLSKLKDEHQTKLDSIIKGASEPKDRKSPVEKFKKQKRLE